MYCQYAGCDCIVCLQIDDACSDCELRTDAYFKSLRDRIELCEIYLESKALSGDDLQKLKRIRAEVEQMKTEYLEKSRREK